MSRVLLKTFMAGGISTCYDGDCFQFFCFFIFLYLNLFLIIYNSQGRYKILLNLFKMMIQKNKDNKFIIINKYQIDYTQLLGKGGMASVYLGYYAEGEGNAETRFAVKQISINSSYVATDSLLQQINLLRKINHPFILKYVDAKKSSSSLYLFLQFCDGGTLEDEVVIHEQGLPNSVLKKYIAEIALALKYMKDQKIIHRDIKPKNILLHEGNIKISDFGVAKIINEHNFDKQTVTFSGTFQFMSPQILRQQKYTFQTDIWSLGITIFFMVFRHLPWTSNKVLTILKQIQQGERLAISQEGICPELRDLLQQMLIEQQDERITIQEILEHEFIKDQVEVLKKQFDMNQIFVPIQITKDQFMITNAVFNPKNIDTMHRRSILMKSNFRASQLNQDRARDAYKKLTNFKQQILFFKQILQDLRYYQQKKNSLFTTDLFKKCQFLLVKRCYIIAKDLHQILLFGTHAQGNIMIPQEEFKQLIDEGKVTNNYNRVLREEVSRLYEEFKNDWLNTKESFYEYQRKFGIKIIPREDAYIQNLVENRNLILAFNDCFLQLFMILSKGIVQAYGHKLSEPIIVSSIVLNHGVNITFVYDLMIVLCFAIVSETGNMKAYKDKKKYVSCQQFIYRVQIAYKNWTKKYEQLMETYDKL